MPDLDLSGTEWPDMPHSEIVNAAIARARGRVNGYPDRYAAPVRRLLAERHGVAPEQIVLGNGAAELLQSAALALLGRGRRGGDALALLPALPADGRARGRPAGVRRARPACSDAVTERTRVLVVCNPNDPTGDYLRSTELGALLAGLPEHVHVLLDEALVHFQDVEDMDACLRLVDAFPRLLVVRTFSKVYGLSGLRAGYAVGSDARPARRDRPGARRERADPGRGRARAAHRRRRDRPPPPRRRPRAQAPAPRSCGLPVRT